MKNNWVKHSKSYLDTEKLGIEFSKTVSKGTIVLLNGDLGSGKTTFAKGVLRGLNYAEEVTSPTYTLINEYNADYDVIHIDCYREKNINRWLNIGLIDYRTVASRVKTVSNFKNFMSTYRKRLKAGNLSQVN